MTNAELTISANYIQALASLFFSTGLYTYDARVLQNRYFVNFRPDLN